MNNRSASPDLSAFMEAPPMASSPPPRSRGRSDQSRPGRVSAIQILQQVLFWTACIVALGACFWNMQPYIRFVRMGLVSNLGMSFPRVGLVVIILGVGVWAFLQAGEIYPVILKHDRRMLRAMIESRQQRDTLNISDGDDGEIVDMKRAYNSISAASIRKASRYALFAYALDAMVCVTVFPPAPSLSRFLFYIFTGRWGSLNWTNIMLIVAMMFVFEAMVRVLLFLNGQRPVIRRAYGGK